MSKAFPNPKERKTARALQTAAGTELGPGQDRVWRVTCLGNGFVVYLVTGPLEPEHCPRCGRDAKAELITEGAEP